MTKRNTAFVISLIIVLAGFYVVFDKINELRSDVSNLELALEISKKGSEEVVGEATSTEAGGNLADALEGKVSIIPTAIIFDTPSSPLLEPRTNITVTVESVSKTEDGIVNVNIRVFTSEATAYSALEPRNFFELIDLEAGGKNIKPVEETGAFSSIPPKSAVSGKVSFKIEPAKDSIILQVSYENAIKYYELNFGKKTYKETVLG